MGSSPTNQPAPRVLFLVAAAAAAASAFLVLRYARRERSDDSISTCAAKDAAAAAAAPSKSPKTNLSDGTAPPNAVTVAHVGNSIQYYNDGPRFLFRISSPRIARQDSCLRGGANLPSILTKGNGMSVKFATPNALREDGCYDVGSPTVSDLLGSRRWDYVILNDHTQYPARHDTRNETVEALKATYAKMLRDCGGVPVFLQTWAYRTPGLKDTDDLGNVSEFTSRVREGYELYASVLAETLPAAQLPRVAPVGDAFEVVHDEDRGMWEKLFHTDGFHPSPHGSYLEGLVLHWTIFGVGPERESVVVDDPGALWSRSRVMQPAGEEPLPRPTKEECGYLFDVVRRVCGVGDREEDDDLPVAQ